MIKEKRKITKYNYKKTRTQVLMEYVRTILFSILISIIITSSLALHARNEMIKTFKDSDVIQNKIDKKVAEQILAQKDYITNLQTKNYGVCIHVAELYDIAKDMERAEYAYKIAVQKSPKGIYKAHLKLAELYISQEKFDEAENFIDENKDIPNKGLIKFKTRAYISMGDKYFSIGKPLSAAKSYEKARFYYDKFSKKDKTVEESIKNRIINSYQQTADVMVKSGLNSDAYRFLKKAEEYDKENFVTRYKIAIVLSDLDPEKSIKYLEELLKEKPQDIDYEIYGRALMNAANIADLDNRPTKAKHYRYKIRSIDMFLDRKVIYKKDVDTQLRDFVIKKNFFTYPLNATYEFLNISNTDIINLKADFVLTFKGKDIETITKTIADKNKPLFCNAVEPNIIDIKFNKKIFTKKDLENYTVKIYLYKDEKYKTLTCEVKVPRKTIKRKNGVLLNDAELFY